MIIKLIHQKLDKELEKIPHKFGEQSIKIKMIVAFIISIQMIKIDLLDLGKYIK